MKDDYDFSHAKPAKDVPALARIQKENQGKERITIRIDTDVLAWFRAQVKEGGNYQTLINDTLRAAMNADEGPLTVRKLREVLRQELKQVETLYVPAAPRSWLIHSNPFRCRVLA